MKIKKEKHMKYNIKYIQNKIDYNQNKIKFSDKMGYLQVCFGKKICYIKNWAIWSLTA